MYKYHLFSFFLVSFFSVLSFSQSIGGGYYHTVFLCEDSTAWSTGTSYAGELGIDTNSLPAPAQIASLQNIIAVAVGGNHSLALDAAGNVFSWGINNAGQLGDSNLTSATVPIQLNLENIIKIEAAESFSFAIRNDGRVWAWGKNTSGQLGLGHNNNVRKPTLIPNLEAIKDISGGQTHTIALKTDGTVWAWGDNTQQQLGDGTTISTNTPNQVTTILDIKRVSAAFYHSVVIKNNGSVWAWGYNAFGMLGNGTTINSAIPVSIAGINNAIEVASGQYHTIIKTNDSLSMAWGINNYGQLGNGNYQNESTPFLNTITNVENIFAGIYHSGAYNTTGQPFIWGLGANYQTGNGTTANIATPSLLNLGCIIQKMNPICLTKASFTKSTTNACQGSEIEFTNTSQHALEYRWLINGVLEATTDSLLQQFNDTGNYEVTLIANPNGCPDTIKQTVIIEKKPTAILYFQGISCVDNDSLKLVAIGNNGIWLGNGVAGNNFNPSGAGVGLHEIVYTMINGLCANTDTLFINVSPTVIADFSFSEINDTVTFNNLSNNALSYQWHFGDGQTSLQESPTHIYNQEGIYYVLLLATNNCGTKTNQQNILISTTGIERNKVVALKIYPIPTTDRLIIEQTNQKYTNYKISNSTGQEVLSGAINATKTEIDLSTVARGSYFIQLKGKQTVNHPIIITR